MVGDDARPVQQELFALLAQGNKLNFAGEK